RPRRRLRPRASGLRSRAPGRAVPQHAFDVLAVPAGQRILRAGPPAARDALADAASGRRSGNRGRMARRLRRLTGAALGAALAAALTLAGTAWADPAAWQVTDGSDGRLVLLGSVHYL